MNFYLENKNYDLPQVFIKFLIILSPIVGIFVIFFIYKTIYYICLRLRVRMKKLDINLLRWHFNLLLESNKVFYLLKDVNTDNEVEQMIKKAHYDRLNPHNFNVNYDTFIDNNIDYDGISIDSIDSIATTYSSERNEREICSICLSNIDNYIYTELYCGHKFHLKCLNEWVKNSKECPLCKREILEQV